MYESRSGLTEMYSVVAGTSSSITGRGVTSQLSIFIASSEFAGINEGLDNAANFTEGRYTGGWLGSGHT